VTSAEIFANSGFDSAEGLKTTFAGDLAVGRNADEQVTAAVVGAEGVLNFFSVGLDFYYVDPFHDVPPKSLCVADDLSIRALNMDCKKKNTGIAHFF
jgi:hypothetical protein